MYCPTQGAGKSKVAAARQGARSALALRATLRHL